MDGYLKFAQDLADAAGTIMLEHFQIGLASRTKPEEGNTPVTVADTDINHLVVESVRSAYPRHAVIGEEESFPVDNPEFTWVCDPIDGTIPYTMGVPLNVFSLALVDRDGQPVVAVVYDPYMKRKFWAVAGKGAFVNGQRIRVNTQSNLGQAYVGFSGRRSKVVHSMSLRDEVGEHCHRLLIYQSTIYEAMLVAAGQIAAVMYPGSNAHDTATSALIVAEAGGRVTDMLGRPQRYDEEVSGAVISNGAVHDELVAMAKKHAL